MTAAPTALWSLAASPEYDPGREVLIDCEEYGLPHLPGWDVTYSWVFFYFTKKIYRLYFTVRTVVLRYHQSLL
jgi:hypothetical protein